MAPCNGVKVCSAPHCSHVHHLILRKICAQNIQLPQQVIPEIVQSCSCISFRKILLMIIEGT